MRTRVEMLAVVGLSCVLLTGCADASAPTGSARSVTAAISSSASPVPTGSLPGTFPNTPDSAVVLDIDAYRPTAAQAAYLTWSGETITNDCLASLGIDKPAPRMPTSSEIGTQNERRYGVIDRQQAAIYGYHIPNEVLGPQNDSTPTAPDEVLNGGGPGATYNGKPIPEGGCRGQVQRALGTPDATTQGQMAGAVANIDANSYATSQQAPSVRNVFSKWSSCMGSKGFTYATPNDAINAADLNNPSPSKSEISTALADVDCKASTGVIPIWVQAENDIQAPLIAAQQTGLVNYKASFTAALSKAAAVTGVGVPQ